MADFDITTLKLSSWQLLCAFLTSVGVNINQTTDAEIHVSAGVTEGAVAVTQFARDETTNAYVLQGSEFLRETKTYTFSRPLERVEPRLVQEEVPDV